VRFDYFRQQIGGLLLGNGRPAAFRSGVISAGYARAAISEQDEPGEFEGMNEQELAKYIGQKMAELGIEIVREEGSELSVLSST